MGKKFTGLDKKKGYYEWTYMKNVLEQLLDKWEDIHIRSQFE